MRAWWRSIVSARPTFPSLLDQVHRLRRELAALDDDALTDAGRRATDVAEVVAVTAIVAARVLGVTLFDVQLQATLALADGRIVEMQTGEGKTLAAVPAIVWYARPRNGVHVLTANDYLARRDAAWMGGIYRRMGLSVGVVQQDSTVEERRAAYRCDVTYATAREVGFDYLRDQLALSPLDQVLRTFATAVVDEADSILIDDARIPLVIAGGAADEADAAARADRTVRRLVSGVHFTSEQGGRNVALTAAGITAVERLAGCDNLFAPHHLALNAAVQDALHAHTLLRRDVDYIVHDAEVRSVDELTGRIVRERRWPAGLQTALEWKEGVPRQIQGRVLGSVTVQNLIGLYPAACGMTGTAASQADEFHEMYGLEVDVIPTNRPVIRVDHPDRLFDTRADKEDAIVEEIRTVHATGRPVLIGTSSVEESERLSRRLAELPHQVLNARNEEAEAAIVARAGARNAVTISTNMAGRGVDIQLDPDAAAIGGLHVVGTNRHESRRIDHQLRGRAGRQGDAGSSRFFVSNEDALMVKYSADCPGLRLQPDTVQRIAEGENLDIRLMLRKYETVLEGQRLALVQRRQRVLTGALVCASDVERLVTLQTIDELWADYLAAVSDLRAGTVWISLGASNPFDDYLARVHGMYQEFERAIDEELPRRLARAQESGADPRQRGATWTYLTTDEPFGPMTQRFMRGLVRRIRPSRSR
jgi:preprotein translocase subunit SecA